MVSKVKKLSVGILMAVLAVVAVGGQSVYATIVWGGSSASNTMACSTICRITGWENGTEVAGAAWVHYDWGQSAAGVSYDNSHVYIKGEGSWAPAGTITPGGKLSLCKEEGYWRYAHVAYAGGTFDGGGTYSKWQQVGLHPIGDTDSSDGVDRASEAFSGTFQYNEGASSAIDGVKSFWKVKELYVAYGGNGDDWHHGSGLSWFCGGTTVSHMTSYHSHSSITVNDGSSNNTVNSGWDRFNSGNFQTKKSSVSVSFAHQLGRRADSENVKSKNISWELFGKLESSWSSGKSGSQNFNSNTNVQVNTNSHTGSVPAGTTKTFCQGLRHRIRVDVDNNGNAVSNQPDTRKATSEACMSVTNISGVERNPSDPITFSAFVGGPTHIQWGAGQYRAYFYVSSSTTKAGVGSSTQAGDTQSYGTMSRDVNPPALPNAKNVICGHYPVPGKNGVCNDGADGEFAVPDELSYVGAKICAANVTTNSEFDHYEYDTETRTRKDVDGNSVTETIQVPKPVYRYYLKFSNAVCSPIAKKPNTRVTNGNLYASGNISASIADKKLRYTPGYFGSWSEYLAIVNGSVDRFASGATFRTGYSGNTTPSTAQLSPLTIARKNSSQYGSAEVSNLSGRFIDQLQSLINNNRLNDYFEITHDANITTNYYGPSSSGKIRINIVDGNINNGNINILSNVNTINAWLISTSGTINTCSDVEDTSSLSAFTCNSQLTVNGIVYAPHIKLHRTFISVGAGAGSATSAEVFNITPEAYINSYRQSVSSAKQYTEVYTQELAPRV